MLPGLSTTTEAKIQRLGLLPLQTDRHRQKDRQTERDRQRQRHGETQTETETYVQQG